MKAIHRIGLGLVLACLCGVAGPASAATIQTFGKIEAFEAEFAPSKIVFHFAVNPGQPAVPLCTSNLVYPNTDWLWFDSGSVDTNKAVHAVVIALYLSRLSNVMIQFDSVTCQVSALRPQPY